MGETRHTLQKEIIHQALCEMANHPTAAMVYQRVHETHPTISRSTVYRVLGQLAEEGRVLRLALDGSDSRFDGTTCRHGHVRCRLCGRIGDVSWCEMGEPADTGGFLLEDCAVEYRGLCPDCRRKAEEK